jgi:hypothetical protein
MKTTVADALRIKKEISEKVNELMLRDYQISYGNKIQDNVTIDQGKEKFSFIDYIEEMKKIFKISEQINSALSLFSVNSGISDKVRHRQNLKFLLDTYENALDMIPKTSTCFEIVGDQRIQVTTEFKPYMTKNKIKSEIKSIRSQIREIQVQIDYLNSQIIELPFEYEDIEE